MRLWLAVRRSVSEITVKHKLLCAARGGGLSAFPLLLWVSALCFELTAVVILDNTVVFMGERISLMYNEYILASRVSSLTSSSVSRS